MPEHLLALVLAIALWASMLATAWLMLLRVVPIWPRGISFLMLFFLLAVGVTAVIASREKDDEEKPKGSNGRHPSN